MTGFKLAEFLNSENIVENIDSIPSKISLDDIEEYLDLKTWNHSKKYKNSYKSLETNTYIKSNYSDYWCMRHTTIPSVDANTFRDQYVLNLNGYKYDNGEYKISEESADFRVLTEKNYIHKISDVRVIKKAVRDDNTLVQFKVSYKLMPLLSTRHFYQWVYINKPFKVGNTEVSYVVSFRSKPDEKQNIKCHYVAIELLKYNTETKDLDWYMATAGDAAGNIPMALQKLGIDDVVVDDVPSFLKYIKY